MNVRGLAVLLVLAPMCACSQPAGQAGVQTPPLSVGETCGSAESQAELAACWTQQAERVQRRVADAQQSLLSVIGDDPELSAAIVRAQDDWTQYRDAHCGVFARLTGGGSSAPLQQAICEARLGAERERELVRVSGDVTR